MSAVGVVAGGRFDRLGRGRDDPVAERGGGGEDAVVGGEMNARSGDQRGQAFDRGEGIEHDMRGAASVAALELSEQRAAVGTEREALMDEWRARGVATERFEFLACEVRHAGRSRRHRRRACRDETLSPGHGTAAEPRHRCAGLGSERDAALD